MAKKTRTGSPAADRAFLRGAVRAPRSPKASPGDAVVPLCPMCEPEDFVEQA